MYYDSMWLSYLRVVPYLYVSNLRALDSTNLEQSFNTYKCNE